MKLLKKLLTILLATSGALFTVYQFNLDMKLVGWLYNVLHEFHTRKPVTTWLLYTSPSPRDS